ncbi:MAG: Fe-S cluster assembly protein SufD [Azoarcus sp.]|uniref:Iron-regulated ABC transporter permease protein SufD n=1 Tax=Aromatoleum tolulyticum TaxID=34027 RepID=A0A1N7BMH1_9RHOO|nr:Fe-S cluster assembly protein SufD [Azoarcus sp.]SIR52538.1 Iron-regulated ABC transporter permease protein SufD [Aromatoleum tolulyticum]
MRIGPEEPCVPGFVSAYPSLAVQLPGAAVPWLRRSRDEAFERFAALGLPTTRDEDWKYTSVAAIARRVFRVDGAIEVSDEVRAVVLRHAIEGTQRMVFVDGHFVPGLSQPATLQATLPEGARVGSLAQAVEARADDVEPLFAAAGDAADGFSALNAALWSDGAWIDLAAGVALEAPVHLLFVTTRSDSASFPRNLIRAGEGASATVIEHHVGPDGASYLSDTVTRIVLGRGARIAHTKLQQEGRKAFHVADVAAEQGQDSAFVSHALAFGGQLSRAAIATRLGAEGCDAKLAGLYVGSGRQHIDHHTCIDHAAPRGTSRELYKGVLDEAARAVFNGRVIVRPDAQRSDALQSNRNLLLSEDAEVDTKPQLEIWADDVKCAHGATVGQLDADQLHYLRARGIAEGDARALLIRAFAADALAGIEHGPLRARLESLLPGALPEAA